METIATLNGTAIALTEANRPHEAIDLFHRALEREPGNPVLWLNLGIAQQRTGSYELASDSFRYALNLDVGLTEAWFSLGLIHYEKGEFELSRQCYDTALQQDDSQPKAWNNLGVLYFAEEDYEKARDCFERAVSLAPDFHDALFNLRDVCTIQGDRSAEAECRRALSRLSSGGSSF